MFDLDPTLLIVLEWSAVVLNLGFTLGIAWNKRWGWMLGIVASVIGILLYAYKQAWAMTALNGFYAVMGVYGWISWGRAGNDGRIRRWTWPVHVGVLAGSFLSVLALSYVLRDHLDGTMPHFDAFITVFGFVATWMMAHRVLENWVYWTIGDLVAIYFNWAIGYDGYAILNALYVVLSVIGMIKWIKQWKGQRPVHRAGPSPLVVP